MWSFVSRHFLTITQAFRCRSYYTLSYCEAENRQVADFLKFFEQIQQEQRQFDRYLAK